MLLGYNLQKKMRQLIIIVLSLAIVLGFLFWKFAPNFGDTAQKNGPITLTIWGLFEDENSLKPAIDAYKLIRPNVTIAYQLKSSLNYRTRSQTQIANGQGPDILMLHSSWIPMFVKTGSLSFMPDSIMSFDEYSKSFYPVVTDTLTMNKKVFAFPHGIDGLSLYYNEDILQAAGVSVPQSWDQFVQAAVKTTVIDQSGQIQTAGGGIGTVSNVDYWSDVLGLLFLEQPGAKIDQPANDKGADVLRFYTSFITDPKKKIWDVNLQNASQMFSQGKLAFYFGPSAKAYEFRLSSPTLKFKTAPMPQLPGRSVGWASFYSYAVSSSTKNQQEAFEFLKYLTSAETEKMLYQQAVKLKGFGLAYDRVDLQSELLADPIMGSFVLQGPV